MKSVLHFTLILLLAGLGPKSLADDNTEIETDVELSLSDSDAARAQAREAKAGAEKERKDTLSLQKQAKKPRLAAEQKNQEARLELVRLDKEIQTYKSEQKLLKNQLEKHNR